jgi:transglycosylase-like protein with SLT domain
MNSLAGLSVLTGLVVGGHAIASVHHRAVANPATVRQSAASPAPRPAEVRADRSARLEYATPLHVRRPDAVVLLPRAAPKEAIRRLQHRPGVRDVAVLSRGAVTLRGHRLTLLGAGPDVRGLTPELTARSDALWASVARDELTLSYANAEHWRHRLGDTLVGESRLGDFPLRLGAFAALGLGRADGLVDEAEATMLGLRPARELVVIAPHVGLERLRADVDRLFGPHARMHSLRAKPVDQNALISAYARATIPAAYLALYRAAAATCTGLPWTVLAAIGAVETGHGANRHVSSKGAMGPMQFLPSTFAAYAVDGDHNGVADIRDPDDAVYTAARYLCFTGAGLGGQSLYDAVWAYNHADWYVREVLNLAVAYS